MVLRVLDAHLRVQSLGPGSGGGGRVGRGRSIPDVDGFAMGRLIYWGVFAYVRHGEAELVPEASIVPRDYGAGSREDVHDGVHREHRVGNGRDQDELLLPPGGPD